MNSEGLALRGWALALKREQARFFATRDPDGYAADIERIEAELAEAPQRPLLIPVHRNKPGGPLMPGGDEKVLVWPDGTITDPGGEDEDDQEDEDEPEPEPPKLEFRDPELPLTLADAAGLREAGILPRHAPLRPMWAK